MAIKTLAPEISMQAMPICRPRSIICSLRSHVLEQPKLILCRVSENYFFRTFSQLSENFQGSFSGLASVVGVNCHYLSQISKKPCCLKKRRKRIQTTKDGEHLINIIEFFEYKLLELVLM